MTQHFLGKNLKLLGRKYSSHVSIKISRSVFHTKNELKKKYRTCFSLSSENVNSRENDIDINT